MLLNRKRMNSILTKYDIDVLIIMKPENAVYLSDFHPMGSRTIKDRFYYILYFKEIDLDPVAIVPNVDLRHFQELSWIPNNNIHGYVEFKTDRDTGLISNKLEYISETLKDYGIESAKIGIEMQFLPYLTCQEMINAFKKAEIKDCTEALKEARMIKSPEEIKKLKKAESCTEEGCKAMIEMTTKEGVTELETAIKGKSKSILEGAETIGFIALGGGARSAIVHNNPRKLELKSGEVFRFDYGAIYDGYWGDLARSFVLGRKAKPKQQHYFDAVLKAQETALKSVRIGITAEEIFEKAIEAGRAIEPSLRREHVGHGIGTEIHEEPILRAGNKIRIEPGMVLCVEVGQYIPDVGGFQIEDTIIVKENDIEILSKSLPKKLLLI